MEQNGFKHDTVRKRQGLLGWFARNHVAANLLMLLIIVAGLLTVFTIKVEFFPDTSLDIISISVPYRGASPAEVEEGVCIKVEEAVAAVEGIKRMYSFAYEGLGTVLVEVDQYSDTSEVLDDIKAEVDRIITFPEETEKPIITELTTRYEVLTLVVYGDASERTLREIADEVRNDLTAMENISQADLAGVRPYEISIEVSEQNLRKYNLSFDELARVVRNCSLDVPGGSVKTRGGEILFRTKGQKYLGREFEKIIVRTANDGTKIRLADVATVIDGFEDTDVSSRFDGKPAALVKVYRIGQQGALDIAETVRRYVRDKQQQLPEGISLAIWQDSSEILRSRINLLKKNAYLGLTLVFLCLTLFLNFRLAFWTTMGIPISFLGAFYLLPIFGVSLNMISLFAFIMSLGLVVDDAIVVGENIFACRQRGLSRMEAAVRGVKEMAAPVVMAVLTTVFAFAPLLYTSGIMGKILRVIPIVVISVLMVSLAEALLVLPAHLSAKPLRRKPGQPPRGLGRLHILVGRALQRFVDGPFARVVARAVRYRYVTLASAIVVLLLTVGMVLGGYIKFTFFDPVEADNMVATVTMPQGTPLQQTLAVVEKLERAAEQLRSQVDANRPGEPSIFRHMATTLGQHPSARDRGPAGGVAAGVSASHLGEVNIELLDGQKRGISSKVLASRWRQMAGEIPGVSSLTFTSEIFAAGEPINVELSHENFDTLVQAAEALKQSLRQYEGVTDIADSFEPGKAELKLSLKDKGRMLGLTLADLGRQVRQGFYGEEVQRIQRGRDDVRVMLRYPASQRRSLYDIENMRIRLADGTEIPFRTVAAVRYGRGYADIQRADRRRVVNVTADVDRAVANANEINMDLYATVLPELRSRFPGLLYRFAGEQRERSESLGSLKTNFVIALLAIYGLLAVQFRSYTQPAIVMSAIPFGLVGATLGHLLLGFNLSLLSMFGLVALSGVVVNDSLIMIDLINRLRSSGEPLWQVIRQSATRRFRPIMLTTLTTFFGLAPMMLERSLQARFLIPMAISLAFGVLFATMITLLLVPSLYMIIEDAKRHVRKVFAA